MSIQVIGAVLLSLCAITFVGGLLLIKNNSKRN